MPYGVYDHFKIRNRKQPKEIIEQRAKSLRGKKRTLGQKKRMSEAAKTRKISEEGRQKRREAILRSGRAFKKGVENPHWQGGKSFEPYTTDWTEDLRRAIRKRDKYTCQLCGAEPAIQVHHIDYDKKNCDPKNLIILCHGCHCKTNFNRDYWTNYFNLCSQRNSLKS